jgi:ComF family protein
MGVETEGSVRCGTCRQSRKALTSCWWAFEHGGAVRDAIHRAKYGGVPYIGHKLGTLWRPPAIEALGDRDSHLAWDVVIPIPLHRKRLRQRGYNQSALVARAVARSLGVPLDTTMLRRVRDGPPQVGLTARQRAGNVRGVFSVRKEQCVRGKRILLIDDVVTTGSTMAECAKTLSKAGALRIDGWSITREQ